MPNGSPCDAEGSALRSPQGAVRLNVEARDVDDAVRHGRLEPRPPLTLVTDVRGRDAERSQLAERRVVDGILPTECFEILDVSADTPPIVRREFDAGVAIPFRQQHT